MHYASADAIRGIGGEQDGEILKIKTLGLFLCTLIAMSTCGITYAQWNDVVEIRSRMRFGTYSLRFVSPLVFSDSDDATKDVGKCTCEYAVPDAESGGFETLEISITNAYPGYEAYCTFTLENVGSFSDHIYEIEIIPGTGLLVGETKYDTEGNPIGWRLDDFNTNEPLLQIYIYEDTDSSLVCNTLNPGDSLQGKVNVQVDENAQECHSYSFEVKILYD